MACLPNRLPETHGRGSIAPNRPDGRFDRIPRSVPISPSRRTQRSGPGPPRARSQSANRDFGTGPRKGRGTTAPHFLEARADVKDLVCAQVEHPKDLIDVFRQLPKAIFAL